MVCSEANRSKYGLLDLLLLNITFRQYNNWSWVVGRTDGARQQRQRCPSLAIRNAYLSIGARCRSSDGSYHYQTKRSFQLSTDRPTDRSSTLIQSVAAASAALSYQILSVRVLSLVDSLPHVIQMDRVRVGPTHNKAGHHIVYGLMENWNFRICRNSTDAHRYNVTNRYSWAW